MYDKNENMKTSSDLHIWVTCSPHLF